MSNKKKYILNTVSVNLGCGTNCRTPSLLSAIFHPKPPHRRQHHSSSSSSSSSWNTTTTTTAVETPTDFYSPDTEFEVKSLRAVKGFGRIGSQSMAVEKDSDDPYHDFLQSMLQMILEKEIYSKDDLKELLNCFLQLNSPCYHGIIVRAFKEIWNGVYSAGWGSSDPWSLRDF